MERFRKLKWTDEMVQVQESASTESIQETIELLKIIDPDINTDQELSKLKVFFSKLKLRRLDQFMEMHCRRRHYMFQIMKCQSDLCGYCNVNPTRIPAELMPELHFVPDPVPSSDNYYKDFQEVYGTDTTDEARPSISREEPSAERDKQFKNLLIAGKVRGYAMCCECGKRRVIYSAKKFSQAEDRAVTRVQEELIYTCGSPLFSGGELQNKVVVKEGITCNSPIEAAHYAGVTQLFEEVCFHCGDTEVEDNEDIRILKEQHGIVRPICSSCLKTGKPIKTRNALKIKKKSDTE